MIYDPKSRENPWIQHKALLEADTVTRLNFMLLNHIE